MGSFGLRTFNGANSAYHRDIACGRWRRSASFSRSRAIRHEPKRRDLGGRGGDVLACTNDDVTIESARLRSLTAPLHRV